MAGTGRKYYNTRGLCLLVPVYKRNTLAASYVFYYSYIEALLADGADPRALCNLAEAAAAHGKLRLP